MTFESISVGQRLGELNKGIITTTHIMRWSASVENWHRIHYDQPFATEHDHLPNVLINGSWKQHVMVQLAKDSLGPSGWLWRLKFRYKKMDIANDTLRAVADVVDKQSIDGLGIVILKISLLNQNDEVSTAGHAMGVLPLAGGKAVPYPFVARASFSGIHFPQDD